MKSQVLDIAQNPATAGAVLQRYAYSGYGLDVGLSGVGLTDVRYVGQLIDPTTGLSFNRARWYDREQGRFMQTDPWGGDGRDPLSLNKYLYGHGNPTNAIDPSGRFSLLELLVTAVGGQSLEKLAGAARGVKVGIEATKMLVRLALVQMEILTRNLPPTEGKTHIFVTAYYLYSWYAFETAYKKKITQAKLASRAHRLAKYVASLSGGAERLREHGYDHHKGKRARFLPDDLKGIDEAIPSVFIPYTGTRSGDYKVAYLASVAPDAFDLSKAVAEMVYGSGSLAALVDKARDLIGSGLVPNRTWHHSEILGIMESVDQSKHGGFQHAGGVSFWQIVHNKKYG